MTLRYTDDRKDLVKLARGKGMSDADILRALLANEFGDANRLQIIFQFAPYLGLSEESARELAAKCGLIRR
jgi:hypothetical protein